MVVDSSVTMSWLFQERGSRMILSEIVEVFDTVSQLNEEYYAATENYEMFPYEIQSDSYTILVLFMGQTIWNSEDDSRKYVDEECSEYEPLRDFLIRESKKITGVLNRYIAYGASDISIHSHHDRLYNCLSQIISDLPSNRDWLDPALEAEAKQLLKL
jgi:hypothetical protein